MTQSIVKLIPIDETFVPRLEDTDQAVSLLKTLFKETIEVNRFEEIEFIDQGSNFEQIVCPVCSKEIDPNWWQEEMNKAYLTKFRNLMTILPCCKANLSLNELGYTWPAGFSKYCIEILNPSETAIIYEHIKELEDLLKTKLKIILSRY
ncbi:hypothetical protein MJA45_14440 [Paenibacillus aurantius]|uniref:Uncharacterized protein n=1 Tax=Paenibacillus aurantius TaxID=2918900 RepID=A0AA96LB96_9BACL|nr:hypothetical protein [Paenibacillus aurantius]WNQ08851.1 hypothetical protein MJA45_14440 [Paenibacillus aurantius]